MPKLLMATGQRQRFLTRLAAWGLALPGLWLVAIWLNQTYVAGLGWLWLSSAILAGGLVISIYYRRRQLAACPTRPRLNPLQVSCLASEALGVQLIRYSASPDFAAALPFLTWPALPYIFIASGLAGLAWHSLGCHCHDEALASADPIGKGHPL